MTFPELLDIVSPAYCADQDFLKSCLKPDGSIEEIGDTLALFIVSELQDTFVDGASDEEQLRAAQHALNKASLQISRCYEALADRRRTTKTKLFAA